MDLVYWKKCSFWLGCENEKFLISVFNAKKQLCDRKGNLSLRRPSVFSPLLIIKFLSGHHLDIWRLNVNHLLEILKVSLALLSFA